MFPASSEIHLPPGDVAYTQQTEQRYEWLWHLRKLSSVDRLRKCGMYVDILRANTAEVRINSHGRAKWANVCLCGLGFICPVCAPHKAARERRRLLVALCKAAKATEYRRVEGRRRLVKVPKYAIFFVTGTVPHEYGDDLKATNDLVLKCWSYATGSGRKKGLGGGRETWLDVWGVDGFARCLDLTVGLNGWHPHIHAAVIVRADRLAQVQAASTLVGGPLAAAAEGSGVMNPEIHEPKEVFRRWYEAWFFARWNHRLKTLTGKSLNLDHGIKVEYARDPADIARYVLKEMFSSAAELTEGNRKTGSDLVGGLSKLDDGDKRSPRVRLSELGHRSSSQLLSDLCELDSARIACVGMSNDEIESDEDLDWYDPKAFSQDQQLWHEFEAGMKGRAALRASNGFWKHPDFGVESMSYDELNEYLDKEVAPADRKELTDPETVLYVVPWLYSIMVRRQLDGWALRVCEERGEAFKLLRAYCLVRRWKPPPSDNEEWKDERKWLKLLVSLAEVERVRDRLAQQEQQSNTP